MSATTFTADLRDIRFALHEHLDIVGQLKRFAAHAELDRDSLDAMLDEGYRVATEAIAPINVDADRLGCTLDGDGNVTTPASFKAAWDTYRNGGWGALSCGSREAVVAFLVHAFGSCFEEPAVRGADRGVAPVHGRHAHLAGD